MYKWFSGGVASLPAGKKFRLVSATSSPRAER